MSTIEQLELQLKNAKSELQKVWIRKVDSDDIKVMVFKDRVLYTCQNICDVTKVLNAFEPYETSHVIDTTKKSYINSPYRIDLVNDYYQCELNIDFYLINHFEISIRIDFKHVPNFLFSQFFISTLRGLYDTETVYVNLPSHYKKFKDIRINSNMFKNANYTDIINWYGGNKTLLNSDKTHEIITYLKTL